MAERDEYRSGVSNVPLGRAVRAVTYYTLSNAAWDRRAGVHDVDNGLDIDLEGETFGMIWGLHTYTLEILPRSLETDLPEAERVDVSSRSPWSDVIGSTLVEVTFESACVLRIVPESHPPIWIVAGNYVDDPDAILEGGDSILVIHDVEVHRRLARADNAP